MQAWLNFWIFIFWLSLIGFIINPSNFVNLILFSEITWVSLYCYSALTGVVNDDINLLTLSFLILGLAGVEFVLGLLILVIFRNFNKTLNLMETDLVWYNFLYKNKRNLAINKKNFNYFK